MKGRYKSAKKMFLTAHIGCASSVDARNLSRIAHKMKGMGIDAICTLVRTPQDVTALSRIAECAKREHMYLIAEILKASHFAKIPACIDSLKCSAALLKKHSRVVSALNVPLFLAVGEKEVASVKRFLRKRPHRVHAPVICMSKKPDQKMFSSLLEISRKPLYVGYIDATEGVVSSILALSWGSQVIEKPLSLKASKRKGKGAYSLDEFQIFLALLKECKKYLQ